MKSFLFIMLLPLSTTHINIYPSPDKAWSETLAKSGFKKTGIEKLNYAYYQYEPVGLGGTVMRVDPWGFGYHSAPKAERKGWHQHKPYFGYQYWWDKEAHRFNPFLLKSGYGKSFNPGKITAFNHYLDIRTGVLDINLTLEINGISFTTTRNVFVTPEGILVIRVKDSGAPSPLQLNIEIEPDVRIYNNMGVYAVPHEPWSGSSVAKIINSKIQGGITLATRPQTSTAALAVAVENQSGITFSDSNAVYSTKEANGTVVFYIAPSSSFKPGITQNPEADAWNAAYNAKKKGYEALRQETADWWNNYLNKSKILIPDEECAKLYARSLYYHGVYFGETSVPPGCNSTDIESFAGAVCPEYDLTFSQLALVYSGHHAEAKNVAQWLYDILPKARENATKGISHHNVIKKYSGGAKYTTLTGYDGALLVQPTIGEGVNLHSNYPGANAALMALSYLDFSGDTSFRNAAYDILKATTYVSLEDMMFDSLLNAYVCRYTPSTVQQGSVLFGYNECVKRGIAAPEWSRFKNKILIPTTTLDGDTLIAGSVGAAAKKGIGDATWLQPVWWNGVVDKHDPVVPASYKNAALSQTGNYVFNNGTMGVVASKLYWGNEALLWLQQFQRTDILYDEVCLTEVAGKHELTPEIGAHGAYICNLSQMLLDPDDDKIIDIFPALPDTWKNKPVAFSNLYAKGALSISAAYDINRIKVSITNNSGSIQQREIRISIPGSKTVSGQKSVTIQNGFITDNLILLPGKTITREYILHDKTNKNGKK